MVLASIYQPNKCVFVIEFPIFNIRIDINHVAYISLCLTLKR